MTGGTPLFTTTPIASIRGLAGALVLLIVVAFVVVQLFGQERPGPELSAFTATETISGVPSDR